MKAKSIFWLASMLMCGVLYLPMAVDASPNTPSLPATPIAFCDGNLSGLVSTMLAFNAANGGVSSIGNALGIWQRGTTSCWEYSGALASGAQQFSLQSNLAQDTFLSNQDICYSGAYKYCLNQTFDHPANQVINIGFNTLTFNGSQLDNYYQICYDSNLTGGIACVTGAPTGSTNVVVTLPISGTDKLQIDGHGLAVQYVTLGNNSLTPTAIVTNTPTPTPTSATTCTDTLIRDCNFNGYFGSGSDWTKTGSGVLTRGNAGGDNSGAEIIVPPSAILSQVATNTGVGSGDTISVTFRMSTEYAPQDYGCTNFSIGSAAWNPCYGQPAYNGSLCSLNPAMGNANAASCANIGNLGTSFTYYQFGFQVSGSFWNINHTISFSWSDGCCGNILYYPKAIDLSVATATPTNTPGATSTKTATPTPTPVSFDGTALPTYTPAPTSTATFLPGTPTPTATTAPCNSTSTVNVPPPSNIIPSNIGNIPLLGGAINELAKLLNGAWTFSIDLFIPQHLNCDFGPIQTAVSTRITVPNLATIVQPLSYAHVTPGTGTPTGCGYLGVKNLQIVRPNGINQASPFATMQINIGVDGCAAPWITYFPFGRSMVNFSILIWFAISSLKFFLSFFTIKSFDEGSP